MRYRIEFKTYRRKFRIFVPLYPGLWMHREGIIIRLEDEEGRAGFGEVAPMPWFGSETQKQAIEYLNALGGRIDHQAIRNIPDNFLCLRSAIEMALILLGESQRSWKTKTINTAGLLPSGWKATDGLKHAMKDDYKVLKIKVSGEPVKDIAVVRALLDKLPFWVRLRIDANARLNEHTARRWLEFLEGKPIDFLEQPLPPEDIDSMRLLTCKFLTPLALDESVAGFAQLKSTVEAGWTGPLVVKPSLLGDIRSFLSWRERCPCRIIFSSAFETSFGYEGILRVAAEVPGREVHGLGTLSFMEDDGLCIHKDGAKLKAGQIGVAQLHKLWERMPSK